MRRYIALLRGINVGGKNKISMSFLKQEFLNMGFLDVGSYINSGNLVFSSLEQDMQVLEAMIEQRIAQCFDLHIPTHLISQEDLMEVLDNAPDWWGREDKAVYDNLIFLLDPLDFPTFYNLVGDVNPEYEMVFAYKGVVFWSFSRSDYQKTNWWSKTAKAKVKDSITIRTANTIKSIVSM